LNPMKGVAFVRGGPIAKMKKRINTKKKGKKDRYRILELTTSQRSPKDNQRSIELEKKIRRLRKKGLQAYDFPRGHSLSIKEGALEKTPKREKGAMLVGERVQCRSYLDDPERTEHSLEKKK